MHGILPLKSILAGRHIGTSGQCPLCSLHAEDILHMMFGCQRATSIWRGLGLENLVNHVMRADRSGSVVLEILLQEPSTCVPGFSSIMVPELIATTCWYIWWLRRRQTHGESTPPVHKCISSIRALVANYAKAGGKPSVVFKRVHGRNQDLPS
jgi:hypothetical protein